jgi:hypothetical protein
MTRPKRPRRRWTLSAAAATVLAALIAAVAVVVSGDSGGDGPNTTTSSQTDNSNCKGTTVSGSNNKLDCRRTTTQQQEPQAEIKGQSIPVECRPEGETIELRAATSIEVHVWCSEVMIRKLVQTKLKVWASNATKSPLDVSLPRWALLVPGSAAAKRWSAPPGKSWPRPTVLHLPEGTVTAIPANPDGEAEVLGQIDGATNYSFATHWKKQVLAPRETWHPPQRDASGQRYGDGTLVFYVPLIRRGKNVYEPTIYGLARMNGKKVVALCPVGRWGKRVSAEKF